MLPHTVLEFIARKYNNKPVQTQEYPIISAVRFATTLVAGPPGVYTIDATARVAFGYGIGQDMAIAGRVGVPATLADTTIQNPGQTRDQADVFIYGASFWLNPQSEGSLIDQVMRETIVQIQTNSDVLIPAGRLIDYPQPGGIYGAALSAIRIPPIETAGVQDGGQGVLQPFVTNGNPTAGSFRQFDEPIFWAGLGSGTDSNLNIICTPVRAITRTAAIARVAGVAGATYNGGPAPFTIPTAANTFVEGIWCLHAATVKRRGVNAG